MSAYTLARRCVQLGALALFCLLPWINWAGLRQVSGSLFSLNFFGLPFADPVAAAQVAAGGLLPAGALLWGALCSLALALLMGRVFCSWFCPYGLFSELVYAARCRMARRHGVPIPASNRAAGGAAGRNRSGRAFAAKAAVLLLGLSLAGLLGYPVLNLLAMPGELSLVPLLVWQGAGAVLLFFAVLLPLAALLLEAVSGKRLWCRYVCPQSVLLGAAARCLPSWGPGLRVAWHAENCSCRGERPCRDACSLGLDPRRPGGPDRWNCTMCGDCLRACAKRGGALRWAAFGRAGRKPHHTA
ncbi:4Fe-4S binding protein [Desulfovibrio sp.]|uniref:4Fe-4S binding protein n=1 Tax=Desulfovibrio sp. TaxID=885 RepID=UPI0025B9BBE6|nr:4Fe-4S binding protein [Desulfovibrio sp.]